MKENQLTNKHAITAQPISRIPPDDPQRSLKLARPNTDESLPHISLVGDAYTILLSGNDTNGRDMLVPPGGGPGPQPSRLRRVVFGRPGTGDHIEWMAIHLYAIRDGKVLEDAVMTDALAIMQQLGLVPSA